MNPQPEAGAARRRRTRWQASAVVVISIAYALALWWIDRSNGAFSRLLDQWIILAACLPLVLASYVVRYVRWSWLLKRRGDVIAPARGFLAYLAGFALTATPGKAGELLRVRYFDRMGVLPARTMAVFVFERACDLLVILMLSLLAASVFPTIGVLCLVVLSFTGALFGAAAWPAAVRTLHQTGMRLPGSPLRRTTTFLAMSLNELRVCLGWRPLGGGLLSGSLAWGLTSLVFVGICTALDIAAPTAALLGIYPLAMLIGALSFVPGGVGTTELAIVLMLGRLGIPAPEATAAAIGVRLVTLWFAIVVGALSLLVLECTSRLNVSRRTV